MRRLLIFLLLISGSASAQLVLQICSPQLPCPGFPLGSVQAPIDANGWRHFKLTLTQNVTLFSFIGTPPPSQAVVNVIFTQDATGGRTVTFASNITSPCTITTTANSTTLCQFEFDGVAGIWIGVVSGGIPGGSSTQIQFNNGGTFGGLSNVAAGSALVSNGAASAPIFQTKPVFDLRDISGIDCGNATDSSTALAALFAGQKEYAFPAGASSCNIKLSSTVEPASTGAWSTHGLAGAGGFGAGTIITCAMSAAPCLWFDRQRDSDFGDLFFAVGSASVGLQISQMGNTSGQISTNNYWHDISMNNIGSGNSGIILGPNGDSTNNNELQRFYNISLNGSGTQVGIGFNVANPLPNCRGLELRNVSTNNFSVGYNLGCGTMHMMGGLQESNALDFSGNPFNHTLGGGFITQTHSESSKQWLANWGSSNPFGFLFNRNEMNTPDLTKYQWDISADSSSFISMGNMWGTNANVTKMVLLSTVGGNWISIGDSLPNATFANLPDISHVVGQVVNIGTTNRLSSSIAVTNGANGDLGTDLGLNGLYLAANDSSDGGSLQSFYASPGLDIAAIYNPSSGPRQYVPWRLVITGTAPTGVNPAATLNWKIDNDPFTGIPPATTGPLSMDFTAGVRNGGILKLPATTAITYGTSTNCAAVGTAANPSVASCTAAVAGSFSCATNATGGTCQVNTTAVTANSEIFITQRADTTTGTRLGVTCNTTLSTVNTDVTAVTAGTSFTINLGTITTNPECFSYHIIN